MWITSVTDRWTDRQTDRQNSFQQQCTL